MICPDCNNLDANCFRCDGAGFLCDGCGETEACCLCKEDE